MPEETDNGLRFLSNIHDPSDPKAKMYLVLDSHDWFDPQGHERAWERHMRWVNAHVIGDPQPAAGKTVEQMKAEGWVGLYARQ